MTHTPHPARPALRRAAALLLAAAAFPSTALAQETVTPPTVLVPAQPAPAPVTAPQVQAPTTTTAQTAPGESRTTIAPGVVEQAEAEARERAAARQAEARQAPTRQTRTTRAAAPVTSAPTTEPAPAPQAVAPQAQPAQPVAAQPVAQTAPVEPPVTETAPDAAAEPASGNTMWLILAALGGIAVVVAGAMLMRRRREDEPYIEEEVAVAAPVEAPVEHTIDTPPVAARAEPRVEYPAADPVAAAPVLAGFTAPRPERMPVEARIIPKADAKPLATAGDRPALDHAELVDADPADVAALLGNKTPGGSRPQLELAMRPIRAGMSRRGATVGFELTVANAGGVAADDVRIGAFMLGENAARETEIERLLVNPPVDSIRPAERLAPGDGTTLEGSLTMSREQVDEIANGDESFTPVLVADARYRLPDGREGRTAAAFKIGRVNGGEHLVPIAIQDDPSMYADIEAELVGVPAKV